MLKFLPDGVAGTLLVAVPEVIWSRPVRNALRLNLGTVPLLVLAAGALPSRVASSPSMFLEARLWPLDEDELVLVLLVDELLLDDELDDDGSLMPRRLAAASAALLTSPLSSLVVAELKVLLMPATASEKKSDRSWAAVVLDQSGMPPGSPLLTSALEKP